MIRLSARDVADAITAAAATIKGKGVFDSDKRIRFVTSGGDMWVESFASGTFCREIIPLEDKFGDEIDACVGSNQCVGLAPQLRGEEVDISVEDNRLVFRMDADDKKRYPSWSLPIVCKEWSAPTRPPVKGSSIAVDCEKLREAIAATGWTLAAKLGKVEQEGLNLAIREGELVITGASNATLSIIRVEGDTNIEDYTSATITQESIPGVVSAAKTSAGEVIVTIGRAFVNFSGFDFDTICPVLHEPYREYHKLVPEKFDTAVELNKSDAKEVAKSALALIGTEDYARGHLLIRDGEFSLTVIGEKDKSESVGYCDIEDKSAVIDMNIDVVKFRDMLNALTANNFNLSVFKHSVVATCGNQTCLIYGMS